MAKSFYEALNNRYSAETGYTDQDLQRLALIKPDAKPAPYHARKIIHKNVTQTINEEAFENEYQSFIANLKAEKAKREALEAEIKPVENVVPTEIVNTVETTVDIPEPVVETPKKTTRRSRTTVKEPVIEETTVEATESIAE